MNAFPFARCLSCYSLRSTTYFFPPNNTPSRKKKTKNSPTELPLGLSNSKPSKRRFSCRATTETEPDGNNDDKSKEEPSSAQSLDIKESLKKLGGVLSTPEGIQSKEPTSTQSSNIEDSLKKLAGVLGTPEGIQSKEESASTQSLDNKDPPEKIGVLSAQEGIQEKDDDIEVARGSPLPGMEQLGEPIMIPKATVDILKDQVFGFDTFYVTTQEPYERGVLFKGNLRGKAAISYEKITKRLQDRFGDEYRLFLLINPEDDQPVAVVVPRQTLKEEPTAVPEWFAAGAFGLVTVFTLLLRNVPALQSNLLSTLDNLELLKDGLPGALVTALVLGFHEVGHLLVARDVGAKLGVPYFVPSWQIGSFGAITRIISIMKNREDLLKLAAAGPLAGFSLGFILLLLGFILPPSDGIGIVVDPAVFHESFLVGGIAKLLLGDALREGTSISLNPVVLWAWAGLLINAINSIPAGELDGGRISFALWGRKASSRLTGAALALLGLSSLFNDVAFYWGVLIFFLQRGPIAPLSEEISDPESKYVVLGVAILLSSLLVCLPYPFPFTTGALNFDL
ncbi:putative zinc metalloprotease EGY2, chloroplastic [Iris pallida]|uniref:Zinc metalloprotease EGY2, chloroplastic n=1 Tax=Iris pallida TaxID=29817 RepID=A0AAX6EY40_IRIPA|nr:putative zinc metalloprotease EGY2, chloroplastic [Iris pallida]